MSVTILEGDCLARLAELPEASVHYCVTLGAMTPRPLVRLEGSQLFEQRFHLLDCPGGHWAGSGVGEFALVGAVQFPNGLNVENDLRLPLFENHIRQTLAYQPHCRVFGDMKPVSRRTLRVGGWIDLSGAREPIRKRSKWFTCGKSKRQAQHVGRRYPVSPGLPLAFERTLPVDKPGEICRLRRRKPFLHGHYCAPFTQQ